MLTTEAEPRTHSAIVKFRVSLLIHHHPEKATERRHHNKIEWQEKTERSGHSHRQDNHPTDLFYLASQHGRALVPGSPRYNQDALCWCLCERHSVIAVTRFNGGVLCARIFVGTNISRLSANCLLLAPHSLSVAVLADSSPRQRDRVSNGKGFCYNDRFDFENTQTRACAHWSVHCF